MKTLDHTIVFLEIVILAKISLSSHYFYSLIYTTRRMGKTWGALNVAVACCWIILLVMRVSSPAYAIENNTFFCGNATTDLHIVNYGCSCDTSYSYYKELLGPNIYFPFRIASSSNNGSYCTTWLAQTSPGDRTTCINGTLVVTVNVFHTSSTAGGSCGVPPPPNSTHFPTGAFCSLNDDGGCGGGFAEQSHDTQIPCVEGISGAVCPVNQCRPSRATDKGECDKRISSCHFKYGIKMKWGGKGCKNPKTKKRKSDGGCQCDGYCGYTCKQSCNSDSQCRWHADGCYSKSGVKGSPKLVC